MYRRILLASDGSREGLGALREGALIAQTYDADVFLLIIDVLQPGARVADSVHPLPTREEPRVLLDFGLGRMAQLGMRARGRVVHGEPVVEIAACAELFRADLVVLGHRRQSLLERWWAGPSGAYVADRVRCSVLVARNMIGDEDFEKAMMVRAGQVT